MRLSHRGKRLTEESRKQTLATESSPPDGCRESRGLLLGREGLPGREGQGRAGHSSDRGMWDPEGSGLWAVQSLPGWTKVLRTRGRAGGTKASRPGRDASRVIQM